MATAKVKTWWRFSFWIHTKDNLSWIHPKFYQWMWSELHFALERRKSTMLLFTTKLCFVGKQICTTGKKPNYILLMKLSDWKVQAVLNLSIFPCREKKKEKQSLNWVFTNTKTESQRRKGHSRTTELWLHLNSATPALHFRLYFLALLSHSKNGTQQSRRVCARVSVSNKQDNFMH